MTTLGSLKQGDVYAKGKYKVISNDGYMIHVIRLADKWHIAFHNSQVNWNFKVEKV